MSARESADRRIYQSVAASIARQINDGELVDGTLLPSERELAEAHGASRASIREALLSLQASGLIALRPRARARVTQLSHPSFFNQLSEAARSLMARPNGIADFQEARQLFECGLVRHAARHASPKEIDRLASALALNERAIGNPTLFAKTDLEFHDVIAEIHRNPVLSSLNSALAGWLMALRTIPIKGPFRGVMRTAYRGHEAVFEAIAAHDPEAAEKAMTAHLQASSRYYRKTVAGRAK